jgi:hypothetical protein
MAARFAKLYCQSSFLALRFKKRVLVGF